MEIKTNNVGPLTGLPTPAVGDMVVGASGGRLQLMHTAAGVTSLLSAFTSANLLAALASDKTGTGVAVFSDSPTFTTQIAVTRNALGATSLAGSILQNLTPAVNGTQQFSPMAIKTGQGFDTVAVASKPLDFCDQVEPAQAAGNPTGLLRWYSRQNNGAWVSVLSLSNAGVLTCTSSLVATNGVFSGNITATSQFRVTGQLAANTVGDGLLFSNLGTGATSGSQRYSHALHWQGLGFNVTAAASRTLDFRSTLIPVQQASGEPVGELTFDAQVNAAGYTNALKLSSVGGCKFPTTADVAVPTPSAGELHVYFDGTNFKAKNSAATVKTFTWT